VFKLPNIGKFPEICSADGYVIVTASDGNVVYFIKNGVMHNVTVMQLPQGWLTIITLTFYMWAVSFFVLIEIFLSVYNEFLLINDDLSRQCGWE
jgi:hypothetical protein